MTHDSRDATVVLHVFGRLSRGGAELRTLELVRSFPRAGYRFDFCALSGLPGELDDEVRALGGKVHHLPLDWAFPGKFIGLLRRERVSVVHSHVHLVSGMILALAAAAGVGGRVAHFRSTRDLGNPGWRRKVRNLILREVVRVTATDVLAVSRASLNAAMGTRYDSQRAQVIYNALDLDRFRDASRSDWSAILGEPALQAGPVIVHVGSMTPPKNHERALAIFAEFYRMHASALLVFAGRGTPETVERLKATASLLGVLPRVRFLGARADVPRLLKSADAMLFPSLWEGLPGAVLEARAAGTPVVASDIPEIREIAVQLPGVNLVSLAAPNRDWAEELTKACRGSDSDRECLSAFEKSDFALQRCVQSMEKVWQKYGTAHVGRR